jgi:RNA polymerase sigma factor (TIGR02999 family)
MQHERANHSLQTTALVHEAYIKLVNHEHVGWQDRAHFLRVAVRAMRQILVDYARHRATAKAGAGWQRISIDQALGIGTSPEVETLALDETLERLSSLDERMARIVELRVFGGLTMKEVAQVLRVSERTVRTDWTFAKVWLGHELSSSG